jgi:hypothetical protein
LVDNIKTELKEIGWGVVDWIGLAQDRNQWRALVNTVMNLPGAHGLHHIWLLLRKGPDPWRQSVSDWGKAMENLRIMHVHAGVWTGHPPTHETEALLIQATCPLRNPIDGCSEHGLVHSSDVTNCLDLRDSARADVHSWRAINYEEFAI